jgi:hypothetical protein
MARATFAARENQKYYVHKRTTPMEKTLVYADALWQQILMPHQDWCFSCREREQRSLKEDSQRKKETKDESKDLAPQLQIWCNGHNSFADLKTSSANPFWQVLIGQNYL